MDDVPRITVVGQLPIPRSVPVGQFGDRVMAQAVDEREQQEQRTSAEIDGDDETGVPDRGGGPGEDPVQDTTRRAARVHTRGRDRGEGRRRKRRRRKRLYVLGRGVHRCASLGGR
jgi:hypothetical protein